MTTIFVAIRSEGRIITSGLTYGNMTLTTMLSSKTRFKRH